MQLRNHIKQTNKQEKHPVTEHSHYLNEEATPAGNASSSRRFSLKQLSNYMLYKFLNENLLGKKFVVSLRMISFVKVFPCICIVHPFCA